MRDASGRVGRWASRVRRKADASVSSRPPLAHSPTRPSHLPDHLCHTFVDRPFPGAALWIPDIDGEGAEMLDRQLDAVAVLDRAKPLMIGAAGDDVARLQRADRRGEFN